MRIGFGYIHSCIHTYRILKSPRFFLERHYFFAPFFGLGGSMKAVRPLPPPPPPYAATASIACREKPKIQIFALFSVF